MLYFSETIGIPDEEDKEPILENEAPAPACEPFSITGPASPAVIDPSTVEYRTFAVTDVNTSDYNEAPVQLHVPEEDTTLDISQEPLYGTTIGESTG